MTYIAISLITCEPLSDPAVSIAGREPTSSLRVHYCYSIALQNGGEYAENLILSSIIYGHAHTGTLSILYFVQFVIGEFCCILVNAAKQTDVHTQ